MRQIDSSFLRSDDSLVLLTSRSISNDSTLMVSDFRDVQALIFTPTGSWLCLNKDGLKLGKSPAELIDGIWYVAEDLNANKNHQNIRLSPELLSFEVIK